MNTTFLYNYDSALLSRSRRLVYRSPRHHFYVNPRSHKGITSLNNIPTEAGGIWDEGPIVRCQGFLIIMNLNNKL
jgi:hypothetical protein